MAEPRVKSETGLYEIVSHSIQEIKLYRNNKDKEHFIYLLELKSKFYKFEVHAFVLMDNHFHISGFDPEDNFQKLMLSLLTTYAKYYNKKYSRRGHVMWDRFKSEPLDTPMYVINTSAYIHNNPKDIPEVKGKEETYKYSSYSKYIGKENQFNRFVDINFVMNLFGIKDVVEFNKFYFLFTKSRLKS